jgi:gamma-glutamyl-gamma-aminobutyrate hydrolase PuuD
MSSLIKIAISQRVEYISAYHEYRDCLDQEWIVLLEKLGFLVLPIPNKLSDPMAWLSINKIEGIILSGGNDLVCFETGKNKSETRDKLELKLLDWAEKKAVPVLAYCRGMQLINHRQHGGFVKVKGHAGCEHELEKSFGEFSNYQLVNSYHDWAIDEERLGKQLILLAKSKDNVVEALKHKSLPWLGMMWHPERKSSSYKLDCDLIKEHFKRE